MMGIGTRLGIMPISPDELYLFGTTREQLGRIAVTQRKHALLNKNALFKGPLTLEEGALTLHERHQAAMKPEAVEPANPDPVPVPKVRPVGTH